jgi:hypothetical protein
MRFHSCVVGPALAALAVCVACTSQPQETPTASNDRVDVSTREATSPAALGRGGAAAPAGPADPAAPPPPLPDVTALVGRLDLERYKGTIKALTRFGDRLQGTERNRQAIDWIEAQLQSYGCATERIRYIQPPPPAPPASSGTGAAVDDRATAVPRAVGGGRPRSARRAAPPNLDPARQPDAALRARNAEPSRPGDREEVFCTKVGATTPNEMYIVSAHMDGRGFGEAANDDGSGTALVMELARVLNLADVTTARTIRFALWNSEEGGLNGARAYVAQRMSRQGREDPPGSGRYPEPRWLGVIQHDMMLFDHGAPRADGTVSPVQRLEADVNIEFQSTAAMADGAMRLAFFVQGANERYASEYPASVGPHMTNTDSTPFMDLVPSISLRENERGVHIGSGWNPHWHQPTDLYATFSDQDFRLGLNAAQTTLGAVAELAGARLRR